MTGLMWLGLLAIVVVCFLIDNYDDSCPSLVLFTGYTAAVVLVLMFIVWPMNWYGNREFEVMYEATKETIETSRGTEGAFLERAALTHKVVEINQKLAVKKYWNKGLWDWYIPDDVANLGPIR